MLFSETGEGTNNNTVDPGAVVVEIPVEHNKTKIRPVPKAHSLKILSCFGRFCSRKTILDDEERDQKVRGP